MPKVILDCDLMRFRNSGLYHYCLSLGNHVQRIMEEERLDWKMNYYVPPDETGVFDKKKLVIAEKPMHRWFRPFLQGCDIWHAPFQSGRIIPKQNGKIKVVLTIHDLNALHEGKPLKEQQESLARTQSLIDRSDMIIAISEFTKNDVLANCNVGNTPIKVIHNGVHKVHKDKQHPGPHASRRPFLFGMGYVNRKKNYHVLLPLLKHNPELEMIIAGRLDELDYVAAMQEKAVELGIADRLHITGPVSEEEKAWLLNNCMAFMHPSLAEGFGAPVVEAMLFGKALFLSDRTSLPEIGADSAFYFSSFEEDYMQSVFREGMEKYNRDNLSEAIIKRGKNFEWDKSARQYLDVYKSML